MLAETYHHVATLRIRNMATVGGGLAHADPNQDPPPSLIALGATVKATSANGSRVIPLDEFFKDYYETVLEPGRNHHRSDGSEAGRPTPARRISNFCRAPPTITRPCRRPPC